VADLTAAYAQDATTVRRGIRTLDQRRQVLVQDDVQLKALGEVWWFLHTRATVEPAADGRSVLLRRDNERLWARIVSPQGARFTVMEAGPLPTSPDPAGQEQNADLRKLAIRLTGVGTTRLAVQLVPLAPGAAVPTGSTPPTLVPLQDWRLTDALGAP